MKDDAVLIWNTTEITLQRTEKGKAPRITNVAWADITGVAAYKANLVFLDLICMSISTESGTVEINDEIDGWERLIEEFPDHLPGFPRVSAWFHRVALPLFDTNFTRLYSKEAIPPEGAKELD